MAKLIAQTIQIARKNHHDDSSEWIQEELNHMIPTRMSFSELRTIAKLKANHWQIKKGQTYIRQFCEMDGSTYTFKTLPEILAICLKYNLYPED